MTRTCKTPGIVGEFDGVQVHYLLISVGDTGFPDFNKFGRLRLGRVGHSG